MNYSAIIVAAGQGSRTSLQYNKVLHKFSDGKTILATVMETFLNDDRCKQIIIVLNEKDLYAQSKCQPSGKAVFALGGKTRQESVLNGLMAASEPYVLIHDGARPFLKQETIDLVLNGLNTYQAVIPGVPVTDTIKQVKDGKVLTLKRDELFAVQTPQGFLTGTIFDAYLKALEEDLLVTDDAQVIELTGSTEIMIVAGDEENIKITTQTDLKRII